MDGSTQLLLDRRVIAVTSTGGCGATTVAVHLARELARKESSTVVDLDLSFRGVAARLGIDTPDAKSWADIDVDDPLSLRLAALPVPGGFRVLLAPVRPVRPDLDVICSTGGNVVLDVPPAAPLEKVLPHTSAGVLVVDRTPIAAERARKVLHRSPEMAWAVVVNATAPRSGFARSQIADLVGLPVSLCLPFSAAVREAEGRKTLVSRVASPWSWGIARLANALAGA